MFNKIIVNIKKIIERVTIQPFLNHHIIENIIEKNNYLNSDYDFNETKTSIKENVARVIINLLLMCLNEFCIAVRIY